MMVNHTSPLDVHEGVRKLGDHPGLLPCLLLKHLAVQLNGSDVKNTLCANMD